MTWRAADGHPGRKYVALLLPSKGAAEDGAEEKVHGEGRYRWAREFALETQEFGDSSKSYVLALSDQGARYVPIESNMQLSKRKRDELAHIEPPEHVRWFLSLLACVGHLQISPIFYTQGVVFAGGCATS